MKVEVLYFEGCPNHQPAVDRVREALRSEGMPDHVDEIKVYDDAEAKALKFLGSPSVRVNGMDIERSAHREISFAIACRTYNDGCCSSGLPSQELIRTAIKSQIERNQGTPS